MRAFLFWLLSWACATAAEPLVAVVAKREVALRKSGTVLLNVALTNHSRGLLEGRLEAAVLRGGKKVSTHAGPPLVISPGTMPAQLLLPPPLDAAFGEGCAVRLAFAGKDRAIPLGDHVLGNFPAGGEEFILAIARGTHRVPDLERRRERSLRLESLRPALETSAWFSTASLSVPVEEFPAPAIGWCAYDVVLLDAPTFQLLTARQLDGLARWLEAGGSAAIMADGKIGERQLAFLNRVGASDQALRLDAQDRLERRANLRLPVGLGRLLLAAAPPGTTREINSNSWRLHVAWLWKVQDQWMEAIGADGVWPVQRHSRAQWTPGPTQNLEHWVRNFATETDRQAIERPRPLPFHWVALMLASLLILAGPVDWHVLGWLRRRRWTWIVFPAICAGFAWIASTLATQYSGPRNRATSVQITDVGEDDRLLRDIVFRLRVPSSDEEWTTETADGLALPMQPGEAVDEMGRFEPAGELPETRAEWPTFTRMQLRQNLRQWTPNWQQAISFAPREVIGPPWAELIAQWKRAAAGEEMNLSAMRGDFSVYFLPAPGEFRTSGQVVPADSPLSPEIAALLGKDEAALPDLLEARSPVINAGAMLGANPRGRLAILAWRRTAEGLEILRRHVSARELETAP